MKVKVVSFFIFLLLQSIFCLSQTKNATVYPSTSYTLIDDTLYSNTGVKIYVKQKLEAGSGFGENGIYQQIRFKSPLNWSLLLFHDSEIKNTYANSSIPKIGKESNKLKELLNNENISSVKKITKRGNKKFGY